MQCRRKQLGGGVLPAGLEHGLEERACAAAAVHTAFDALRLAATACLSALELAVGVAAGSWMELTDLDEAGCNPM